MSVKRWFGLLFIRGYRFSQEAKTGDGEIIVSLSMAQPREAFLRVYHTSIVAREVLQDCWDQSGRYNKRVEFAKHPRPVLLFSKRNKLTYDSGGNLAHVSLLGERLCTAIEER